MTARFGRPVVPERNTVALLRDQLNSLADRWGLSLSGLLRCTAIVRPRPAELTVRSRAHTNSIFSQVFVYNGLGRVDQPSPNQLLTQTIGLKLELASARHGTASRPAPGRDRSLIPAALIALVGCLVAGRSENRRQGRRRPVGNLADGAARRVQRQLDDQHVLHRGPVSAIAAFGTGWALAWEHRRRPVRLAIAVTVATTCAYAGWLLPAHGVGVIAGLPKPRSRSSPPSCFCSPVAPPAPRGAVA